MANKVTIYTTSFCPYCIRATMLLDKKKVSYEKISVSGDQKLGAQMEKRSGRSTVPQIFIGKTHVGGYDDLAALNRKGKLDSLLQQLES